MSVTFQHSERSCHRGKFFQKIDTFSKLFFTLLVCQFRKVERVLKRATKIFLTKHLARFEKTVLFLPTPF